MPTRFTLHAHEETASGDSNTSARGMANAYADAGTDLVGFVGHDERPSVPDDLPTETMTGTEHELQKRPTKLHLISFPDQDLKILAHPKLSTPAGRETVEWARETAARLDADAVEGYNRGTKQMSHGANVGAPLVAGDDAHNTHQVASSYSITDAPATPEGVSRAVKTGNVRMANPGMTRRSSGAGRLHQGLSMAKWKLTEK